jgi:hypothetical protein
MDAKYGKVFYEPQEVIVGAYASWKLKYEIGKTPIETHGHIRVGIMGRFCCDDLQSASPERDNFINVNCSSQDVGLSIPNEMIRNGSQYWELTVVVVKGRLKPGDAVEIIFGDQSQGSRGFLVRNHCQTYRIGLWIDPSGEGDYYQVPDIPYLSSVPDKMKELEIIAPSRINPCQPFHCVIRYTDQYHNIVDPFSVVNAGSFEQHFSFKLTYLQAPFTNIHFDYKLVLTNEQTFEVQLSIAGNQTLDLDNFIEIAVEDVLGNKSASNPALLANSPTMCYWGEFHGHTILSDGQLTPDEYLRFAKNRERLDFSGISDHDTHMMRREVGGSGRYLLTPFWEEPLAPWHIIKYETARFNEPGRFVTFLGYEWTSGHCFTPRDLCFGHRNVYYLADDGRVYSHVDPESDIPSRLYNHFNGKDALVIPHHSSRPLGNNDETDVNSIVSGVDWRFHDPRWERLVEIYSKWGNSEVHDGLRPVDNSGPEGTVQTALLMGCKVGFSGGSDTHTSWPGSSISNEGGLIRYRSGLTCVMAGELTRQNIFDSLFKRHCYATSGERIYLEFFVNGKPMGEEIPITPGVKAEIKARVALTSQNGTAAIIRNNQVVTTFKGGKVIEIEWNDETPIKNVLLKPTFLKNDGRLFSFYYLRVTQDNGEMAWSSPVWFVANEL